MGSINRLTHSYAVPTQEKRSSFTELYVILSSGRIPDRVDLLFCGFRAADLDFMNGMEEEIFKWK